MDPTPLSLVSLVRSLQGAAAVELPVQEAQLLLAFLGQDLEGLLEALTPKGARIRFDQGPVVTAEGTVPYPEGTALKLRVTASEDGTRVRLQTLEARPPALPPILMPLVQSEGFALLQRLFQADVPEALEPLVALYHQLASPLEAPPPRGPESQAAPQPPPLPAAPLESLSSLPPPLRAALARVLGFPSGASPETLAAGLEQLLLAAESVPDAVGTRPDPVPAPSPKATPPSLTGKAPTPDAQEAPRPTLPVRSDTLPGRLLVFLALHLELPPEVREVLTRLTKPPREKGHAPEARPGEPGRPGPATAEKAGTVSTSASPGLRSVLPTSDAGAHSPLEHPALLREATATTTLEAWVREGLRVLGHPAVSPQEAPFHVAQGKEQTAFFELPLPGATAQTLQLWVEWEEEGASKREGGAQAPVRLVLGTRFSRLGETRVGFAATEGHLSVRVWTEHPELLENEAEALLRELEETGVRVDFRVLPLDPEAPSLRSVVAGTGWQGMA